LRVCWEVCPGKGAFPVSDSRREPEENQEEKETKEERPEVVRWKTILLFVAGMILGLLSAYLFRR